MGQEFKYYAFISYSSKDTAWGKRLQRKLENYRMPATLCNERGWKRRPINPIFFAPTDIQPGGLDNELQERLRASRNLIVICSPNSAKSEWVGQEISFFHSLGRVDNIHFFIVDGTPHSGNPDTECFNPVVDRLGMPEILGANIHEQNFKWPWLNRERAYVQLVSKLLGVEFDAIWQRHRRLLIQKTVGWIVGILAILGAIWAVWQYNQPFDAEMSLVETTVHNDQLPPLSDAIITLSLDNETKTDTLPALDGKVTFTNIPHRFLDKQVHVTVRQAREEANLREFLDVDTMVILTKRTQVNINRNHGYYGNIRFTVWDNGPVPGFEVTIVGRKVTSDDEGVVSLYVPLDQQRTAYTVTAEVPFVRNIVDMPQGEDDILQLK